MTSLVRLSQRFLLGFIYIIGVLALAIYFRLAILYIHTWLFYTLVIYSVAISSLILYKCVTCQRYAVMLLGGLLVGFCLWYWGGYYIWIVLYRIVKGCASIISWDKLKFFFFIRVLSVVVCELVLKIKAYLVSLRPLIVHELIGWSASLVIFSICYYLAQLVIYLICSGFAWFIIKYVTVIVIIFFIIDSIK